MRTAKRNNHHRRFGFLAGLMAIACLAFGASSTSAAQNIVRFDAGALDGIYNSNLTPLTDFGLGNPVTQAGAHPGQAATTFIPETYLPTFASFISPVERLKDVVAELPPGFVGNPQSTRQCSIAALLADITGKDCPVESQLGYAGLWLGVGGLGPSAIRIGGDPMPIYAPIWNLGPANGTPAVLAINLGGVTNFATASVRTGDDYGVTVTSRNISTQINLNAVTYAIWGNPQDSLHDTERGAANCAPPRGCPSNPSSAPNIPFLSLPTSCGPAPVTKIALNSWEHPHEFAQASRLAHDNTKPIPNPTGITGCNALAYTGGNTPTLEARPTTNSGDSASGLDVDLHTPQNDDPDGTASPHLRDSVVTLPEGLVINPSSANGLGTCDLSQIGYLGSSNEEQTVDLTGIGPFDLTFDGETTATIPGDSDAATVQAALEALSNIGAGDVEVTGSKGGPYSVEFKNGLGSQDVPLLRADGLSNKIQQLTVDATLGFYTLTYGANTTPLLLAMASVATIEHHIKQLASVRAAGGGVSVTGGPGTAGGVSPYFIEFDRGSFAGTDQTISARAVGLSGGARTVTMTDAQAAGTPLQGQVITSNETGHLAFTPGAHDCPDPARLASAEIDSPLLDHVINGSVYLAKPYDNPFNRLIALYITANDELTGIGVKLAGHVELNQATGQVQAVFDDNPQLPFEHLRLHFFGGSTAALRTPSTCGDHTTTSTLTPWSAPDSGPPAEVTDTWQITQNCSGSEAAKPHAPSFDAGAVNPQAALHTPFVVKLRREDGSQNFSAVTVKPPAGLTAKLAGTAQCPEASLAAAANKTGQQEKAAPSCPAASDIGQVVAGAGAGPAPYYAHGRVYLAGPYKGAPISLATIIPATAGPFDLGTVVTRIAAHIDPKTAEITAVSDQIPAMLQGIPLDVKTVDVSLDKPNFSKTGTSCDPLAVTGLLTSTIGAQANLEARYQLGECTSLGFKPSMAIRLKGGTKRGKYPQLSAYVLPRDGDANIRSVSVAFPRSEFLANEHIRTICTRPQFAADQCPAGSIYGTSTVFTPLLDYPLTGNVYLRSSDNLLPDVVPDLRGPAYQPIKVEAAGRTDSFNKGIRNTFDYFPDAPFSRAVLSMQGGSKGLLKNSRDICARTYRAIVRFTSHSGEEITRRPKVVATACKNRKRKKGKRRGHKRSKSAAKRVALSARAGVR